MHTRSRQAGYFMLEALNALGTTYYFFYLYFFTERQFGFTKLQNLLLAAALGLIYGVSSMLGGRFAQRRGCFTALKTGCAIMAAVIGVGAFVHALAIHLVIMGVATLGMALTWPALMALVSEGQSRAGLRRSLGIYNLIWGGLGAVAYFSGGTLIQWGGFRAMFLVPAAIHALQFSLAIVFERLARATKAQGSRTVATSAREDDEDQPTAERRRSPVAPPAFLRMAWFANPFAYLAINTLIAVSPTLAKRLELTVGQAGIFCSVWLFARTGSFLWLWLWPGWHYRFRWLGGAFAVMTVSFAALLLATNLWVVIAAQILFGLSLGLVYCSSIYYSMDVGEEKGEHGGFHEAMIGLGSCAGPALGAFGQFFFPHSANGSTWTAASLLMAGLAGLLWLRFKHSSREQHPVAR